MKRLSLAFIFVLTFIGTVLAVDTITTYDFDDVKVLYATEFVAYPSNVDAISGTWVEDITSKSDPSITVTYGVVELIWGNGQTWTEEFIKVKGDGGSKRFLFNSGGSYDSDTNTLFENGVHSFFWSAKKLRGTTIFKDKTPPIHSVTLTGKYNKSTGKIDSYWLSFSNDGEKANDEFWAGSETPMFSTGAGPVEKPSKKEFVSEDVKKSEA